MWTRRETRALVAVAAQFALNGFLLASWVPRLPELRDQVGVTTGRMGLLMGLGATGGLVMSAAVGHLVSRFGTRRTLTVFGMLFGLALVVVGLTTNPWVLMVGLGLISAFDVPVDVAMNMQGSWLSAMRPVPVLNRLHGLWSLGMLLGGGVASVVAFAQVPVHVHFVGVGIAVMATVAVVSRGLLPDDHPAVMAVSEATVTASAREPTETSGRSLWQGPMVLAGLFLLAGLFSVGVEAVAFDWAAFRLADDFGAEAGLAGLAFVAVACGQAVGRLFGDSVQARVGAERLGHFSAAASALGLVIASFAPFAALVPIGYGLAGLGIATLVPSVYGRAAEHPTSPGQMLGALSGGIRIALLLVTVIIGRLIQGGNSVGSAVALVGLTSLVGFMAVIRAIHTLDRSNEAASAR